MSFSHIRGQVNPVVNYYYDTGAQQRFTVWHVLPVFVLLIASICIYTVHAVTSNVELASAEIPSINLNQPVSRPAPPVETPAVLADTDTNEAPSLQEDIEQWIAAHKGVDWAVNVEALDGSLSASVNADETF